jgi:hypothetical protein
MLDPVPEFMRLFMEYRVAGALLLFTTQLLSRGGD